MQSQEYVGVRDSKSQSELGWKNNRFWIAIVIVLMAGGNEAAFSLLARILPQNVSIATVIVLTSFVGTCFAWKALAAHRDEQAALISTLSQRDSLKRAMDHTLETLKSTVALTESHNQQLHALSNFNRTIQACETEQQLADAIKSDFSKVITSAEGALFWRTPDGQLERRAQWPRSADFFNKIRAARCPALKEGEITNGCNSCMRSANDSVMCVPLRVGEISTGILQLKKADCSDATDFSVLEMAADQLGLALKNMNSRVNLGDMVMRDGLTGAFNRRYLEDTLEREIGRCRRDNSPLSILMLDLDHFKQLNDTLGHAAGDTVLKELVKVLALNVRPSDIVCRYGGEEFVIVLPETSALAARGRADELRRAIHSISKFVRHQRMISSSIGIAAYPEHAKEQTALMRAADDALYEAKRTGRDKAVIARVISALNNKSKTANPTTTSQCEVRPI